MDSSCRDDVEIEIEDLIFSKGLDKHRPTAVDVGKAHRIEDAKGRYVVFLKYNFPREFHPGRN